MLALLGQPVPVENRPGAGGTLAAADDAGADLAIIWAEDRTRRPEAPAALCSGGFDLIVCVFAMLDEGRDGAVAARRAHGAIPSGRRTFGCWASRAGLVATHRGKPRWDPGMRPRAKPMPHDLSPQRSLLCGIGMRQIGNVRDWTAEGPVFAARRFAPSMERAMGPADPRVVRLALAGEVPRAILRRIDDLAQIVEAGALVVPETWEGSVMEPALLRNALQWRGPTQRAAPLPGRPSSSQARRCVLRRRAGWWRPACRAPCSPRS